VTWKLKRKNEKPERAHRPIMPPGPGESGSRKKASHTPARKRGNAETSDKNVGIYGNKEVVRKPSNEEHQKALTKGNGVVWKDNQESSCGKNGSSQKCKKEKRKRPGESKQTPAEEQRQKNMGGSPMGVTLKKKNENRGGLGEMLSKRIATGAIGGRSVAKEEAA